jgi:acetylornithine deacetylase/succinyl-diaminopimelate desuccinylase-like protein
LDHGTGAVDKRRSFVITAPLQYLESNAQQILDELVEFARIPSVSTDPGHRSDIERAANWVADRLRRAGLDGVRLIPTARHPLVYGEWLGAGDAPTILVYGHCDVQPPDPLDKWESPPFEPEVRAGRLYARGVSDDKGPVLIPIKVAEAFLATTDSLPINLRFFIEGEEEIGSPSLEPVMRANPELFAADFVLSADGAMWRIDEPSITVASRGMVGLECRLQGPGKDLHSGRHGGAVANPLHAMTRIIASLHTPDGRVTVAGFYDAVAALTAEERAAVTNLPFDDATYLEQVGAPATFGEAGYSTLERQWTRPTLEVNGMWGGYQGPGSKSVIPAEAQAKITCRLVANQNPGDIREKLIDHLQSHVPPGVELAITDEKHGAFPYRIPSDHVGLKIAEAVLTAVYQTKPLYVRMGGTLPVSELFKRHFDMDTVFFSFSTADEDFHSPNEFFRVRRLHEGLEAWARYWQFLGQG